MSFLHFQGETKMVSSVVLKSLLLLGFAAVTYADANDAKLVGVVLLTRQGARSPENKLAEDVC
jgi:hypothetical protein